MPKPLPPRNHCTGCFAPAYLTHELSLLELVVLGVKYYPLSRHLVEQQFDTWHKLTNYHVKGIMASISSGNRWQPNTNNIQIWWSQGGYSCWRVELSISHGRNSTTSTLGIFSYMNVNCTQSNYWHHHNARSLLHTAVWIIDLSLKLDGGWLFLSLEMIEYATFGLIM